MFMFWWAPELSTWYFKGKASFHPSNRITYYLVANKTEKWRRNFSSPHFERYLYYASSLLRTLDFLFFLQFQMLKQLLVLFLLVTAIAAETAYFIASSEDEIGTTKFIIQLKNNYLIKHARALVNGETGDRPHIGGAISAETASYNPYFSYHLVPESIFFFDRDLSVCDYTFSDAEERGIDRVCHRYGPCELCPSKSLLLKEVRRSSLLDYQASFSRTGGRYLDQEPSCH